MELPFRLELRCDQMSEIEASLWVPSAPPRAQPNAASRFIRKTLVFRHSRKTGSDLGELWPPGAQWLAASPETISLLFAADRRRHRGFQGFLDRGWLGMFLAREEEWIAYSWATPPGSGSPPHLPRWVGELGAYWIFYCHTKQQFRGNGVYRRLLAQMVARLNERKPSAIYADVLVENLASQRAMLASGFDRDGEMTTYNLWIPRVKSVVLGGRWSHE